MNLTTKKMKIAFTGAGGVDEGIRTNLREGTPAAGNNIEG